MNKILLFNRDCNLRCSYCHFKYDDKGFTAYGKHHEFGEELQPQEIVNFLEQFRPYHIEFTGGEPLMYKGFKYITANIPTECTWAITSNTLLSLDDINYSKCISWTCSDHGANDNRFKENIKILKDKLSSVSVSYVVPFARVKEICRKANIMRQEYGVRINLLRELNENINWEGTEELELLRSMPAPFFNVVEDDIPIKYEFSSGWECSGGSDYICLYTDGHVFDCYSDAMSGKKGMPYTEYKKREGNQNCYRQCLGCAEDHKSRKSKID